MALSASTFRDIAMTEVTSEQFRQFVQDRKAKGDHAFVAAPPGVSPDVALSGASWFHAVAFCNWLSEKEGIPQDQWCYEPNAQGKYAVDMKICPDYHRRRGYRLPTEGEWEYACRGGAETKRCYGDADELLPQYAWFSVNAAEKKWPVARLLPNPHGMFDMLGNVTEWCQERPQTHESHPDGWKAGESVKDELRALRGGHSLCYARFVRSTKRWADPPALRDAAGFRVARSSP